MIMIKILFNKKHTSYIIGCFCVLFFGSCEVLDEESLTQVSTEKFYQNETDALAALTAAYARLKSGNGYYKQVFLSALYASSDQGLSTFLFRDFKTGTVTNTNTNLTPMWRDIYIGIRDANNVIANVPDIEMDEELKARIIGEARFLRALHYFNLVRCFGEVPLRTEPVEADDDEGLPVSSIEEIYDVIIGDLENAAEYCWGRNETRNNYLNDLGRATKTAAHALLAKVYIRIASAKRTAQEGVEGNNKYLSFPESEINYYQLAKNQCDLALNQPGFQLESSLDGWKAIFDPENGNNPEMIFDVQGSSIVGQGTAVSNLFSPKDSGLSGTGFGGSNKLKPKFINNRLDKNDHRFQNSIIKEYENNTRSFEINPWSTGYIPTLLSNGNTVGTLWQIWTSKYIDPEATTEYTSRQNWHIIRLADVYLMRAEASVEISQEPSLANADFNILRNRVDMSEFNGSGITMENFRTALLKERAVELYMEGHRFFDLTRMGVLDEYCRFLHGDSDGQRQAEDYFWPIPISETAANVNID
ncbi:MAG: SusD-like protein [Flavobacterium sp. SCGC AAA160-P02]|nr:MAG: SusD-like protein [Flavobacterium sp. SCGC AAA160-P02]